MNLTSQRRLASKILKIGATRVRFDSNRLFEIEQAITREEIRRLIKDGAIQTVPKKGVSRGRARVLHQQKKKGRRRSIGSVRSKMSKKRRWMIKIRAIRRRS